MGVIAVIVAKYKPWLIWSPTADLAFVLPAC